MSAKKHYDLFHAPARYLNYLMSLPAFPLIKLIKQISNTRSKTPNNANKFDFVLSSNVVAGVQQSAKMRSRRVCLEHHYTLIVYIYT